MPHLVYQGRYWKLSGDEFVVPSACAACLRLFWICSLVAIVSTTLNGLSSCGDGWVILLYLFFSIMVCFLAVVCEGLLVVVSLKGSIVDSASRSGLDKYLNFHIVLGVFQFCCAVVGVAIVARHDFPCSEEFSATWDNVLLLAVVVSQLIDMFGLICCFSVFRSHKVTEGEYEDADVENPVSYTIEDAKERWENRCKTGCKYLQLLTCNLFGGHGIGDELETVGAIFANFFHHEGFLDVVPSDVAAGLVLVRLQQRARLYALKQGSTNSGAPLLTAENIDGDSEKGETAVMMKCKNVYFHVDAKVLDRHVFDGSDPKDAKLVIDAAHYAPYALSAYTHLMYLFMHPVCGICQLCQYRSCSGGPKAKSDHDMEPGNESRSGPGSMWCRSCCSLGPAPVVGDNACKINKTAMLKMVENRNGELIYANFSNDLDIKPYGVFIDKDREAVVIAIRGTLSLEDCISDALAEAASMQAAGEKWGFDGNGKFAHSGMLRAAMWIRDDLETSGLLQDLLIPRGSVDDQSGIIGETAAPPDTAVRRPVAADSNGLYRAAAGLRTPLNKKKYRQLVVVGHSLGAGTAAVLAMLLRPAYPSLVSFAYGAPGSVLDENTSRDTQSYLTSVILGKDLVGSLSVKNLSALRSQVLDAIVRCKANKNVVMRALFEEKAHDLDSLMYRPGEEPDSEFKKMVTKFNDHMNRRSVDLALEKLYIPGRILHLIKTKTVKSWCGKEKKYEPTEADLMEFTEIKISPTMVFDHFPDQYCDALEAVVTGWSQSS